jgi:phosphatidylinositol alpha-1,6-mannosyltransferase
LKRQHQLNGKTVFLTVGRLIRRKGFDKVLVAMREALKTNANLAYVIVGQGPEEANLRILIKALGLTDSVRLLTNVEDDEKYRWFQLADVFVMVSHDQAGDYEGFGIVYLEAGLAGKPVIAGNGGGVADAVVDNETGILVDPENKEALVSAILKLAEFEGLRRRLGDEGRRRAKQDFNWEGQAQKIFKFLNF